MKNIELTKDHKSKLLEMCKVLFPKNKVDSLQFGTIKFLINYYERKDINNSKITFGGWDEVIEIHWFEFCIFYLIDKIFNEDQEEAYLSNKDFYKGGLSFGDEHPIDILYNEFQKRQPKEQYLTEHIAHIMGIKTREK